MKHTVIQSILTLVVILVAVVTTVTSASMFHDIAQLKSELEDVRAELAEQNDRIDGTVDVVEEQVADQVADVIASQEELQSALDDQSNELNLLSGRVVDSVQLVSEALPSVFQIDRDGVDGTGFLVGNVIMTNAHVVGGASSVKLYDYTGQQYKGYVEKVDNSRDLAILKVVGLREKNLEFTSTYQTGQRVFVIGNPGGTGLGVTEGVISNAKTIDDGREMIQISAEINHGNSGGPVFDEYGNVIGVVRKRLFKYDGISFAIPASEAQSILGQT